MKIRKTYTLFVNPMTGYAFFGGRKFNARIRHATLGFLYDCTFGELKENLRSLMQKEYNVIPMKY